MSMDAARSRFPECPECGKYVDENDWQTPHCVIDGALTHARCCAICKIGLDHEAETGLPAETSSPANDRAEFAAQRKDKEDAVTKQIQDRMDFQIQCNKVLSLESPERFNKLGVFGVLTPAEMEQADIFCSEGGSGTEFGNLLAARDRLARSEYVCIGGCGKKMLGPFRCPDCYAKWVLGAPKNQKRVSA